MEDETSVFSRQFTGNTSLYFFLHQYRQSIYLTRNLNYLYVKNKQTMLTRRKRRLDSFIFEKDIDIKDVTIWRIYMSHLKIPGYLKEKIRFVTQSFQATLFLSRSNGQRLCQKNIHGTARIDTLDNILFETKEPFEVPSSIFKTTKSGITITRAAKGYLIFTIDDDNETILTSGVKNIVTEEENILQALMGTSDFEIIKKVPFFYIAFDIPHHKVSSDFNVMYFDKDGNQRQTDYILNMSFIGNIPQEEKLDLDSKISLRPKLSMKHQTLDAKERIRVLYIFKAEENNETVVKISTRRDFQCPWCRGKNFHTKQRLHFHFLMNHELFSFKLEVDKSDFLQFEIKLASEYPFKRISEQKVDFRVFQWIRHIKFKHNIENILSDNGKSIIFRNIMLGMEIEQNETVPIHIKPKRRTHSLWPLEKRSRRKFVAPNMDNLYRSMSKRKIIPGEILSESEDDIDETWLIQKHEDILDDFMDITVSEKAFMKLWDRFIIKDRPIGHCHLPDSIMRFVYSHKNILQTENLVNEFWKHLLNLVQYKIIDLVTLRKSMEVLRDIHNETKMD